MILSFNCIIPSGIALCIYEKKRCKNNKIFIIIPYNNTMIYLSLLLLYLTLLRFVCAHGDDSYNIFTRIFLLMNEKKCLCRLIQF